MTLYGSSKKYGAFKYGAGSVDRARFALEVDWDGDGLFNGENIAGYLDAIATTRGRPYFIRKDGKGFERLDVGAMNGTLLNLDGRFNVENLSSPYYPYIPAGKLTRLRVRTLSDNIYNVFAGTVSDIKPNSALAGRAAITAEDAVRFLQQSASVQLQTAKRTDEIIPLILANINYPAIWGSDIDIGADVRDYWWLDSGSAIEALHDLADSELGSLWVAGDGQLRFRSRYTSVPVVANIATEDFLIGSIETPRPWEMVRNRLRTNVYPPVLETAVEVWRWQEQPYFAAGASRTVWANFAYNGTSAPVSNFITPAATTDYVFNTATDGSGTNLTANFSVTVLDLFSGSAKLRITNNGATGGYPTLVRTRADAITVPDETFVDAEDSTSIQRYQRRTFELSLRWFQDSETAQNLTDFMCSFLAAPRLFVKGTITNNLDLQFGIELGEAVNLYIPEKGIDGVYRLAWIGHKSRDKNLRLLDTTVLFEPFPDLSGNYWQFPAEIGTTTIYAP